jgi:hypothetical protein
MVHNQHSFRGKGFWERGLRLLQYLRPRVRKEAVMLGARMLALVGICALVGALFNFQGVSKAYAVQAKPGTVWSYYMNSNSFSSGYNMGCGQGKADASLHENSSVVLDFGGQLSGGGGTEMINGVTISNTDIQGVANAFSNGYWTCARQAGDTTTIDHLAIGTNNSLYDVSYSGGQTWANLVVSTRNYNHSKGYDSQVIMDGANDLEPSWSSASAAIAWAQGFSSVSGYYYYDYGSTDGCPEYSTGNGACNNGWDQYDVWYVSWGSPAAIPTPEIYYSSQALQWTMISLYGAQSEGGRINILGPWDEYDLDSSTYTPQGAWNALWSDLNARSATAQNFTGSMEIHQE